MWIQNLTGGYDAVDDRQILSALWEQQGVLSGFLGRQRQAGANMTMQIEPGVAIVQGSDVSGQGFYVAEWASESAFPTFDAAPSLTGKVRYDLVVVQIDDSAHVTGRSLDGAWLKVIKGDEHDDPYTDQRAVVTAGLPPSAIQLYLVKLKTGDVSITDAQIFDWRPIALKYGEIPPGVVMPYPVKDPASFSGGAIEWRYNGWVPNGWAYCNGQPIDPLVDWRLARILPGTPPRLPDLRGAMVRGPLDGDTNWLEAGGSDQVTLTTPNMPAHGHGMAHQHDGFSFAPRNDGGAVEGGLLKDSWSLGHQGSPFMAVNVAGWDTNLRTTESVGSGLPFSVVPRHVAMPYIIKR
jgi:hypothetical protein